MSRSKSNVHPGHYKVAGRERQGEDIVHDRHKAWLAQSQAAVGNRTPYPEWTAPTEEPLPEKETLQRAEPDEAEGKAKPSRARARASTKALKREGRRAVSRTALARQARSSARRRTATQRSKAARKASRTRARNR